MKEKIVNKLLSGRFFMTVAVISTYCLIIIGICVMAIMNKISTETFLGVFVGFSGLAGVIGEKYFNRNDRGGKDV